MIFAVALFSTVRYMSAGDNAVAERHAMPALYLTSLLGLILGGILWFVGKGASKRLGQREALLLVALGWLVGAALCALPFRVWADMRPDAELRPHEFDGFVNCYFESMSGLTTTGATILTSIGTIPDSLKLWRATTHWLGGLGIVVLFVAVLPLLGVGGRRLYRIESPGPTPEGVTPRIRDAARVLWLIYLGLTAAEVLALRLCGMSWFDALCHTFATLATGGFSTYDESIAAFDSSAIHAVIIFFMLLAGVNFSLYYAMIQKRWHSIWQNSELRFYFLILVVATVILTASQLAAVPSDESSKPSIAITLRDSLFQAVSIQTTTGFGTADFDQWAPLAKITLVVLMFVGASAGSTGGGIKVIRIVVAAKVLFAEVERAFRPKVVRRLKVGGDLVDPDVKIGCLAYVLGIVILFVIGAALILMIESHRGIDLTTAATASAATLNNIGPGLSAVGPTCNYAWFTSQAKVVMCGLMVLGRLEVYAIIVLFTPRFWQTE